MADTETFALRPVVPLNIPGLVPGDAGPVPELVWLPVSDLRINDTYQRGLSEKSVTLIRRMARDFAWSRIKALSVSAIGDGLYEVVDGQHTAIAVATRGDIRELPCLVTSERSVEARAADFVGLNRDRLVMSTMQVFHAECAAGDEDALDAMTGTRLGGGRILRAPPALGIYREGDIVAVSQLKRLAAEGGVAYVRRVVAIGVKARLAPVKASVIQAAGILLWGKYAGELQDEEIVDVLRVHGQDSLIAQAMAARRDKPGTSIFAQLADIIHREITHGRA